MTINRAHLSRAASALVLLLSAAAAASAEQHQQPGAAGADAALPVSPVKVGLDFYAGTSNLDGKRRYSDGLWAGSSTAYPSVAYLRWENGTGYAAKFAVGIGSTFTGVDRVYDQPAEAWVRVPMRNLTVTAGQFWIPFGIQEWQYETKPGVLLEWASGPNTLSASWNYNRHTHTSNTYFRVGRSVGENASVGLSYAFGKGLSFNSDHDRGWGLDGTFAWNRWTATAEYVNLRAPQQAGSLRSLATKLSYSGLGRWQPFVGHYDWNDGSEAFGTFRSNVVGIDYAASSTTTLQLGFAPTSEKNVGWLQVHYAWER